MELNDFINSIGYDGNSAIIDKAEFSKNKGKNISRLLDEGKFKIAAAYAVYNDDEESLAAIACKYNELSGSNYKKEHIRRLFGVSKSNVKRKLFL